MIRLFVAVALPPHICSLIKNLGRSIPGARSVPEEQIHLTLCFLGEQKLSMLQNIQECLRTVKQKPFTIQINGVSHFPPRGVPRVLWAGVTPTEELTRLKKCIDRSLLPCGIAPEKRKFTPHITLSRPRNTPVQKVASFLAENYQLQSPPFTVDSFHLFSSHIGQSGVLHILEESFLLEKTEK